LEQHAAFPFLQQTLLFLVLSGLLVPVLRRLRVNPTFGFLAAGVLVGPFGLASFAAAQPWLRYLTIADAAGVARFAELGVIFLMFMIGLDLSAARLWALRRWVFGAGIVQVAVTGLLLGAGAWYFGNGGASLLIGLTLAMSSTAVAMQLMTDRHMLASPLGQAGFSILMLQDLAVVPLFILLGIMAQGGGQAVLPVVAGTLLKSAVTIGIILVMGRFALRPAFRRLVAVSQPEVFVALTLLCVLGAAALTAGAGLSMALGAFLAGLLLADTEFRHDIEATVGPFKSLLMGLFFLAVGMQVDLREVAKAPLWVAVGVLGLVGIKTLVLAALFRLGRFGWGRALEGALLLAQGGEFAFIIFAQASSAGLLAPGAAQYLMIVVAMSMFATPFAARLGSALAKRAEARRDDAPPAIPPQAGGHVIIGGYGRVGQMLGQLLQGQDVPFIALETDTALAAALHARGAPVHCGDASRSQLLHQLQADSAAAIVLTMDAPGAALHAVQAVRRHFPRLPIFARARDERHALALMRAGATQVIPETLESGLQLSGLLLQELGYGDAATARLLDEERSARIHAMREGVPAERGGSR
jgi:CPA2 family monovalent cation:H+ antiporter-2